MPLRNRVTPFSAVEATPHRGLFVGNRGCLHDAHRRLVSDGWRHKAWIVCELRYKGVRRTLMAPGRWTELFFLDEAVALAAGHRPCGYCRRPAFRAFLAAWAGPDARPKAADLDAALHRDRVPAIRRGERPAAAFGDLPAGTFVAFPDDPASAWLVDGPAVWKWSHAGYADRREPPADAPVEVLTPAATAAALRAGYRPVVHPTTVG